MDGQISNATAELGNSEQLALSYKPGDIIIANCVPFVKVVRPALQKVYCNNCFERSSVELLSCSSCKLIRYCNKNCQRKDWHNGHKLECKSYCYRTYCHTGINVDVKRFLFRMYALLKTKPDLAAKPFSLHDGTTRCFNDLISHQESMAGDIAMRFLSDEMAGHLNVEDPASIVEPGYLLKLLGINKTNAFSILNASETEQIGSGIYIEPSVFNHSCKPTAFYQYKGINLQVRAIGPIPAGEQPHISYLARHLDKEERRKLLRERYNFDCHCERCESDEDSGINYPRLNSLVTEMIMLQSNPYARSDWPDIYAKHEEILEMFRKMYHEYDERIANQFDRAFNIAMNLYAGKSKRELKGLFEDTRHHLEINLGKDHLLYKRFVDKFAVFFL